MSALRPAVPSALRKSRRKRRFPGAFNPVTPGAAPGTITADPTHSPTTVHVISYGLAGMVEEALSDVSMLEHLSQTWPVTWINIEGLADTALIERICDLFNIHKLTLEDVLNVTGRPKVEEYEDEGYLFIIVKRGMMGEPFDTEQISIVIKENVVITFQDKPGGDCFGPVRARIRKGSGKIRFCGTDYLAYALLDAVIDGYFPILHEMNLRLESIDNEIINNASNNTILTIHNIKNDLLQLHRAVWPVRDIITFLINVDNPLIKENVMEFLRDVHDHSLQAAELAEFYRDIAGGLMNTLLAYSGHKMNEIMKVLTMISSVFIPLSFIASIYGMNFHPDTSPFNMPELEWRYGYPFALMLMAIIGLMMVFVFWRKGWLDVDESKRPRKKPDQLT